MPLCINPEHLFTGTAANNNADARAKNRNCNGERHVWAVLSDSDVSEIRAAYTGRRGEQRRLAEHYGIAQSTVSRIVRGQQRPRPTNPMVAELDAHLRMPEG